MNPRSSHFSFLHVYICYIYAYIFLFASGMTTQHAPRACPAEGIKMAKLVNCDSIATDWQDVWLAAWTGSGLRQRRHRWDLQLALAMGEEGGGRRSRAGGGSHDWLRFYLLPFSCWLALCPAACVSLSRLYLLLPPLPCPSPPSSPPDIV